MKCIKQFLRNARALPHTAAFLVSGDAEQCKVPTLKKMFLQYKDFVPGGVLLVGAVANHSVCLYG